jgi:myo-inositol-1(or 4)-monophosphatase
MTSAVESLDAEYLIQARKVATETAREAGAVLRRMFRLRPEAREKSGFRDLVTDADLAADHLIRERLGSAFPDHGILTEESGLIREDSPFRWVVDPLDGTSNFAHGFPHFAVSIALWHHGRSIVGVVHDPMRNETFAAARGRGAILNSRRIRVSEVSTLQGAMITTGFPYRPPEQRAAVANLSARVIEQVQMFRRSGSAALDLAYVAAGRLEAHWEFALGLHDMAAGLLLVHEAGGLVDDMTLSDYKPGCMATNGTALHQSAIALVREHLGAVQFAPAAMIHGAGAQG